MKGLFFLFLLIPLFLFSEAKKWREYDEVIIAMDLNQIGGIYDAGVSGLSHFTNLLKQQGVAVSMCYDSLLSIDRSESFKKCIFLNPRFYLSYTEKEIEFLLEFVREGGSLLIVSEHDDAYKIASNLNWLLKKIGVVDQLKGYYDKSKTSFFEQIWPILASKKYDIDRLCLNYSSVFSFSEEWELIFDEDLNRSVARGGIRSFGKGRIAVIGDYEIFWNFGFLPLFEKNENPFFMLRLVSDLMYNDPFYFERDKEVSDSFDFSFQKAKIKFIYDSESDFYGFSGCGEFFARLLDENPMNVERVKLNECYLKMGKDEIFIFWPSVFFDSSFALKSQYLAVISDKVVFFADRQSGKIEKKGDLFFDSLFYLNDFDMGLFKYESPLVFFEEKYDFKLLPVTLYYKGFQIDSLLGAGLFDGGDSFFSLVDSDKNFFLFRNFLPSSDGDVKIDSFASNPFGEIVLNPIVIGRSESCFLVSDIELFTNEYFLKSDLSVSTMDALFSFLRE